MVTIVVFSIIVVFALLRRVIEPACPACSAKAWRPSAGPLNCEKCGWSNAADAEQSQYEMSLADAGAAARPAAAQPSAPAGRALLPA